MEGSYMSCTPACNRRCGVAVADDSADPILASSAGAAGLSRELRNDALKPPEEQGDTVHLIRIDERARWSVVTHDKSAAGSLRSFRPGRFKHNEAIGSPASICTKTTLCPVGQGVGWSFVIGAEWRAAKCLLKMNGYFDTSIRRSLSSHQTDIGSPYVTVLHPISRLRDRETPRTLVTCPSPWVK